MFRGQAWDSDASGTLNKEEVKAVLLSSGMVKEKVEEVVTMMFQHNDRAAETTDGEMTWEVFRLWLRRDHFADRRLSAAEKIFYTLDDPSVSKR